MKRTRRILGFLRRRFWLMSLVLALTCGWLWRRSYHFGEAVKGLRWQTVFDRHAEFAFTSGRGELAFAVETGVNRPPTPEEVEQFRGSPGERVSYSLTHFKYEGPLTLDDMVGGPPAAGPLVVAGPPRPALFPTWPNRAGFGYLGLHEQPATAAFPDSWRSRHVFVVPYWFLTACLAVSPARRLAGATRALRRRRRQRRGLCAACGYDLRGSTGRCPECGAETPAGTRDAIAGVVQPAGGGASVPGSE